MAIFSGSIHSSSLKMTTKLNIIFPDRSNDVDPVIEGKAKVLYLLHGLSGNADEWLRFSKIEYYAKKYNFIIIMPEVNRSFYCNSKYNLNYFDYIADELPQICAKWFNIDTNKENTFIAGESMGGYGAVKIGLSRIDRFAGIASLSGVLDYERFAKMIQDGEWPDMSYKEIEQFDDEETPFVLAKRVANNLDRPRLIQLCGTEDFLYEDNKRFKNYLEELNYGHTYLEGKGDHEWPYWDKAIQYALMFFLNLDMNNTPLY